MVPLTLDSRPPHIRNAAWRMKYADPCRIACWAYQLSTIARWRKFWKNFLQDVIIFWFKTNRLSCKMSWGWQQLTTSELTPITLPTNQCSSHTVLDHNFSGVSLPTHKSSPIGVLNGSLTFLVVASASFGFAVENISLSSWFWILSSFGSLQTSMTLFAGSVNHRPSN